MFFSFKFVGLFLTGRSFFSNSGFYPVLWKPWNLGPKSLYTGFPVFSHTIPGYLQVKIAILQILVQTPKRRCQRHSKIVEAQNLKKNCFNIKSKCCISKHSRFYPCFLLNFLFCPGFCNFGGKFQAISGPGKIKLKYPGFPGSTGNPVYRYECMKDG